MATTISVTIDEETNLKAYLAIDSTVNGRCWGGVRMSPDLSQATLTDIAHIMTLKHGFLGLPVGGAKAGIVADPEMPVDSKRQLLKSFGQAIKPLLESRYYIPAGDLGISDDDIRFMFASNRLKCPPGMLTFQSSGYYTGLTVFAAATTAARHIGLELNTASVAVEGFGSVGSSVANEFWRRGVRVVAISTSQGAIYASKGLDISHLTKLHNQLGSSVVNTYLEAEQTKKEELLELDVDILCPCASSHSLTPTRVTARIISPGANAPINAEAEPVLLQKGTLYIPDFVANCGGVLGASMKRTGLKDNFIRHFIDQKYSQKVTELIETAERKGVALGVYARKIAEDKFLSAKEGAERNNFSSRTFNIALELYRKGIIPRYFITPVAPGYFNKRLQRPSSLS